MPTESSLKRRTPQSDYLVALGRTLLEPYVALPSTRAAMITGSAAEGVSDFHSDLDMTVYYESELPSEEALERVRISNGAPSRAWLLGDRAEGGIAEAYELNGIQVQIGHITIEAWEQEIAEVLERFNCSTPLHKAMSGTLDCVTVSGGPLMDRWKERIADYPDGLQQAMVTHHLQFFPVWSMPHLADSRDATLWLQQTRLESAFNILGVLAGLNRRYFSTFQFKKMRGFLEPMTVLPPRCADRIEDVVVLPAVPAGEALESLVRDVVLLVEEVLPGVDVSQARRRLGYRRPAWHYARPA